MDPETFLIAEKKVICKVPAALSPLCLLAAYYAFDMEYPKGLSSMYMLFEKILLNKHSKKEPQIVTTIFTALVNID